MAIFADLAAETAERILLYVEDSWTLFNCLLVCQWFHAVAQRAYYHKVTLTNRVKIKFPHSPRPFSILLLFFCQPKNIHLAKSVKTLILRGDDKVYPFGDTNAHWPIMDIAYLIDILHHFPNLHTFEMSSFKWDSIVSSRFHSPFLFKLKEIHFHNFTVTNSHPHSLYSIGLYVGSPFTFIIGEGQMCTYVNLSSTLFLPPQSSLVIYAMHGIHPIQSLPSNNKEGSICSPLVHLGLSDFQHLGAYSKHLVEAFKASQHSLKSLGVSFDGTGSGKLGKYSKHTVQF